MGQDVWLRHFWDVGPCPGGLRSPCPPLGMAERPPWELPTQGPSPAASSALPVATPLSDLRRPPPL
eukprot:5426575-Alexandrium_andersonii.AAC.1